MAEMEGEVEAESLEGEAAYEEGEQVASEAYVDAEAEPEVVADGEEVVLDTEAFEVAEAVVEVEGEGGGEGEGEALEAAEAEMIAAEEVEAAPEGELLDEEAAAAAEPEAPAEEAAAEPELLEGAAAAADGAGDVAALPAEAAVWLRAEDMAIYEEDQEANAEQHERNERMRELLRERRRKGEAQEQKPAAAPEDFMQVSAASTRRRRVAEGDPPWYVSRPNIENVALKLHEEVLDFVDFMKHTQLEIDARRQWVRTIATYARTVWPMCEIRIFGSFLTGLALPNADVDVAILNVPCRPATAMKILADTMLASGEISWLEIIESAKVPVMKIRSQSCGLRADIVVNQHDGLATSKFIKQQLKEFPQMRPLLVFIKYFLVQRGLNDTYTGGMGSYLLCNVVLHFLQRHPSLKEPRLYSSTSLGHLLFDLFKYYGRDFRYDMGISVLDGGYLFRKEERGWGNKGKGKSKGGLQLCLESPLGQPPSDLGGPCYRMGVLRNLFHHAFHCLCHLFVTHQPGDEGSLLCPLLLDPVHGVIAERYELMAEQPVALSGLPKAGAAPQAAADEPALKKARRIEPADEAAAEQELAGGEGMMEL